MHETHTIDHFTPCVNDTFIFPVQDQEDISLTLIEVNSLTRHMDGGREPFSLIFQGPSKPEIPQGTYIMNHDNLGKLTLFLVPVSAASGSIQYESLFN